MEFLGDHATMTMKKDDVVAIKCAKCNEYLGSRALSTTFLTFVEVNPVKNPSMPSSIDAGSPVKKVMRFKTENAVTTRWVYSMIQRMRDRADGKFDDGTDATAEQRFVYIGKVKPFDETIFTGNIPFFGPEDALRLRMSAALFDDEGDLDNATLWSDAAREVTCMDAETVSGLWEKCDTAEGKEAFLTAINAHIDRKFVFNCSLKVWQISSEEERKVVQLHVNSAQVSE